MATVVRAWMMALTTVWGSSIGTARSASVVMMSAAGSCLAIATTSSGWKPRSPGGDDDRWAANLAQSFLELAGVGDEAALLGGEAAPSLSVREETNDSFGLGQG